MMENDIQEIMGFLQGIVIATAIFKMVQILIACRSDDNTVKEALKKCGKILKASAIALTLSSVASVIAGFFGVTSSWADMQRKISNLATNAVTVMLVIETVYVIFICCKEGILYQKAESHEKTIHKKNIENALIVSVLVISATAVVRAILGYFQ